jgi:hypothetical protein
MFEGRFSECSAYLDFLEGLDSAIKNGTPKIGGDDGFIISPDHQKILYSSVYLQLYNLVEATITACLEAVSKTAMANANWRVQDLSAELRSEWVKHTARTNLPTNPQNRLADAIALCNHLVAALPVGAFDIERGGGNWNEEKIRSIAKQVGIPLRLKRKSKAGVQKIVRDDMGAMKLIWSMRNKLAHGSISFVECSRNDTPLDLRMISDNIGAYLRDVVTSFSRYIASHEFLRKESRPRLPVIA